MEYVSTAILLMLTVNLYTAFRQPRHPSKTGQADTPCVKNSFASAIMQREGKCYYFFAMERSWQDAVELCQSKNMHLVHLETTGEQDFIMQHTGGGGRRPVEVWIGLKKTPAGGWAWFYKDKMFPVTRPRWSSDKSAFPPGSNVAQTYRHRTFGKTIPGSRLPVVCEDPQSPELAEAYCSTFNSQIKLGPFSDLHCYYVMSDQAMLSYPEAKTNCEISRTHLIFLETERESRWMDNELRIRIRHRRFWLGIERNHSGQWNWVYGYRSYPVPNPRFQMPNDYQYAIKGGRSGGDNWEGAPEVNAEMFICEEDLYPTNTTRYRLTSLTYNNPVLVLDKRPQMKYMTLWHRTATFVQALFSLQAQFPGEELMSRLLCFHHPMAIGRIYSHHYQHCYYIYLDDFNYKQAKNQCLTSGHLLFVEEPDEQNMIEDEVSSLVQLHGKEGRSVWLGLKKISGNWVWSIGEGESYDVLEERWDVDYNAKARLASTRPGTKWRQSSPKSMHHVVCEVEMDDDLINERVCNKFRGEALPYFNYVTRACYYVFDNKTDWSTGSALCFAKQSHVIHLKTGDETRWLMSLLTELGLPVSVWIGAMETAPGEWSWIYRNHVYELIKPAVVPLFESSTKTAVYSRLNEDGEWHRAISTEFHGVICQDRLTLNQIRQAQELNVGGQWKYGERWKPKIQSLGTTEDDVTTIDTIDYETTLSNEEDIGEITQSEMQGEITPDNTNELPEPRKTTLSTPGEETLTKLSPPGKVDSNDNVIDSGIQPDKICTDRRVITRRLIDKVEFKRKEKINFNVSEIVSLKSASNLKCAKVCASRPQCVVYTWSSETRSCDGYQVNISSSISLDCNGKFSCYVNYCRIPTPA